MDALDFLKAYGDAHCAKVAEKAGTTLAYYRQIAYRHRRPSVDLARALEHASDGQLIATELLFAEIKKPVAESTAAPDQ